MTTPLSQKFAALGMALLMNGALAGTVAFLFSGQITVQPVAALRAAV